MNEIETFIRDAAQRRGINPGIAVQVAKSEGGVDEPARRGTFDTGSSWWPFQLHYGGAGYEYLGGTAGMGNGFTALTGWQPGDPAAWRDSVRYALNRAKASGWGAWCGAAHVGIGNWDGIDRSAPWDAKAEPWDYETGAAPMPSTDRLYGPDVPTSEVQQRNDWTCAVRSTYAALWAMAEMGDGAPVTYGDDGPRDVYNLLVPEFDDASVGLHLGDGSGMVTALGRWGYVAGRQVGASLADVQARAGLQPVLLGFHGMGPAGHWVYCRGVEPDGTLILENPAGTYVGICDEIRDSFAKFGPVTMVWIDTADKPEPAPTPPPSDGAEVNGLISAVAYLADDVAAIEDRTVRLAEARRVREQYVGARP